MDDINKKISFNLNFFMIFIFIFRKKLGRESNLNKKKVKLKKKCTKISDKMLALTFSFLFQISSCCKFYLAYMKRKYL